MCFRYIVTAKAVVVSKVNVLYQLSGKHLLVNVLALQPQSNNASNNDITGPDPVGLYWRSSDSGPYVYA